MNQDNKCFKDGISHPLRLSDWATRPVSEIVSENFTAARVFKGFGIDFCCHGNVELGVACNNLQLPLEEVVSALTENAAKGEVGIPFHSWPLDLLIDYILKIHHRGIRSQGPELLSLLDKVTSVHGGAHPELKELQHLVALSLEDLESHLQKEENVLFPFFLDLFAASENHHHISPMHCGTVQNPIRVMHQEHENEGERYFHIKELTNNFTPPADACATYTLMLGELERFVDNLFEHIHLENNILFPRFVELEEQWVNRQMHYEKPCL